MSTLQVGTPSAGGEVFYPTSDGQPMAETEVHVLLMVALITTLRHHCRRWADAYVIGNIFLYYEEGNPNARRSPDVMVVRGVDPSRVRLSFKTWEERAVPSVVIELTSRGTADEDEGPKKELYERLGVKEYFLFDPLGEYLERPLLGYLNGPQGFEPLQPFADGSLTSQELGLRLVPEGTNLGLVLLRTNERLPAALALPQLFEQVGEELKETTRRADEAQQESDRACQERDRACQERDWACQERDLARQDRDKMRQDRDRALQRAQELEEELRRLRGQQGTPPAGEQPPGGE